MVQNSRKVNEVICPESPTKAIGSHTSAGPIVITVPILGKKRSPEKSPEQVLGRNAEQIPVTDSLQSNDQPSSITDANVVQPLTRNIAKMGSVITPNGGKYSEHFDKFRQQVSQFLRVGRIATPEGSVENMNSSDASKAAMESSSSYMDDPSGISKQKGLIAKLTSYKDVLISELEEDSQHHSGISVQEGLIAKLTLSKDVLLSELEEDSQPHSGISVQKGLIANLTLSKDVLVSELEEDSQPQTQMPRLPKTTSLVVPSKPESDDPSVRADAPEKPGHSDSKLPKSVSSSPEKSVEEGEIDESFTSSPDIGKDAEIARYGPYDTNLKTRLGTCLTNPFRCKKHPSSFKA